MFKVNKFFLGFVLITLTLGSIPPEFPHFLDSKLQTFGANNFSFDLLKKISSTHGENNVIISPYSAYHTIAQTYLGSSGMSRDELQKACSFPLTNEELINELSVDHMNMKGTASDFSSSSALWIDSSAIDIRPKYLANIKRIDCEFFDQSFSDKSASSNQLNNWCKEKTRGKITDLFTPDSFTSSGVLNRPAVCGINAIYFKGKWASAFDEDETKIADFYPTPNKTEQTEVMYQYGNLFYNETEKLQFLRLPYKDDFSMFILLPTANITIQELFKTLTLTEIEQLYRNSSPHNVDVKLPKFSIQSQWNLISFLNELGINNIFDSEIANLTQIFKPKFTAYQAYVKSLDQRALLEVDEQGTEAVAVTYARTYSIGCSASMTVPTATFHANHPFIYFIYNSKIDKIIFGGWYSSPNINKKGI